MEADSQHVAVADTYTGVVIIHGIGNEKRNATLEEAANALTYWFNHIAGLSLRAEGPGRVWLTTQLTDDQNPDAPASRATIEFEAPSSVSTADSASRLRLDMREVWWAQSFGLPSVRSTLEWARLQFREDAARFLLPLGTHSGPKRLAVRHPARETPQALTYRPETASGAPLSAASPPYPTGHGDRTSLGHSAGSTILRPALHVYGIVQYVWKVLQWIALAPLIYFLLLLVGIVRLLALIPISFLQYTLVNAISRLVGSVSLHWVAPLHVYLLDYTRSSAIRQRFERQLSTFLEDPHCNRVVVVAHSMGTVISYEGLTTILSQPEVRDNQKPITFICLAQALRRMWLLEGTDPHRLRRVLPARVRWLHFWARYDPVAAGPVNPSSLPRLAEWRDPEMPDPYEAICKSLASCENVDVVNTDSLFTDHTTYWENLEQVVGPIARELVAGHPALEQIVATHLATPDDILRRRWRVAWRALAALAAGVFAATFFLLSDQGNGWIAGDAFRRLVGAVLNHVGHALFDGIYYLITGNNLPNPTFYVNQALDALDGLGSLILFGPGTTHHSVLKTLVHASVLYSAATAVALGSIFILVVSRGIAQPSPFSFRQSSPGAPSAVGGSFGASVIAMVVLTVSAVLLSFGGVAASTEVLTLYQLGAYVGIVAWLLALISTIRGRHWGWFAVILLVSPILFFAFPAARELEHLRLLPTSLTFLIAFPRLATLALPGALLTLIGCVVVLTAAVANRRWGRFAAVLVVALVLFYALGFALANVPGVPDYIKQSRLLRHSFAELFLVAPLLPNLIYGLQIWAPRSGDVSWMRQALRLRTLSTVSLVLASVPFAVLFGLGYLLGLHSYSSGTMYNVVVFLSGVSALLVGAVPWVLATIGTLRQRRWWWLLAILLVTCGIIWLNRQFLALGPAATDIVNSVDLGNDGQFLSIALFSATLSYALWSGAWKPRSAARKV